MKTRSYTIMCPSCNGTGYISQTDYSPNYQRVCPACNGAMVVTVTETVEE